MVTARQSKIPWWVGTLILATVGITVWFGVFAQQSKGLSSQKRAKQLGLPVPVRTDIVAEREFERWIGATATTVPSETASIWVGLGLELGFRELRAVMEKVHVHEGQYVESGDVLFELNQRIFTQRVKQREMAVAVARKEVDALESLRAGNIANEFELAAAELQVEAAVLSLEIAHRDLDSCLLRSPIDGFVDKVDVVDGEHFNTSRQVTRIHRLDPVHVKVDLPQERLQEVSNGMQAEVVLDSFPNETFAAEVVRMSARANTRTRVLPIVLGMENADHRVRAGLSGFARLRVEKTALTVPVSAVVRRGAEAVVFTVEDGKAHMKRVRLGPPADVGFYEVVDGLSAGDEVVIYGIEYLDDNDRVDTNWREWSGRE